MRILLIGLTVSGLAVSIPHAWSQSTARPTIANEEDFRRAMKELSNWGRWGADDELGAANLITPAKRKQALGLAKEGLPISLANDDTWEKAVAAPNILERTLGNVNAAGTTDRYQYTGRYHGVIHSHLDSVDCHMMVDGKGYNGVSMEAITAAGGCPKGNINALKDGIVNAYRRPALSVAAFTSIVYGFVIDFPPWRKIRSPWLARKRHGNTTMTGISLKCSLSCRTR
jgi:hypothetical protein